MKNLGFDMDGTLVTYGNNKSVSPNNKLLSAIAKDISTSKVHILTNQGGIPTGHRSPAYFVEKLMTAVNAIKRHGGNVESVRISLYHPRARPEDVERAKAEVSNLLRKVMPDIKAEILTDPDSRKPSDGMFRDLKLDAYYGDSPEDAAAAAAAQTEFVPVDRYEETEDDLDEEAETMNDEEEAETMNDDDEDSRDSDQPPQ